MLELMRKHARNWVMKVLLGMVIIVFIFYFGSIRGRDRTEVLATIDGKSISYATLQREYQNLLDLYRKRLGDNLTDQVLKSLNLKQQAFENAIYQALILKKAEELKVAVTDEEVRAFILASPVFQRDGVFNERTYQQTLKLNKMSPDEYEAMQRKILAMMKLEELLQRAVKVSDREVEDLYRFQNEKINLSFVALSPKDYRAKINPGKKDLEGFLKDHGQDFRVPEQVQLKYLTFSGQDFTRDVSISDADVSDYYDRHKNQWTKPGSKTVLPLSDVRPKIIGELKKLQGLSLAAQAARKAYDVIYQEEKFEAYAAQHKLPVHSTGFFTFDRPPQEFRHIRDFTRIAFALQKDEISRALSDDQGYYLVKAAQKKPSYLPDLQEIEKDVSARFTEEQARRLCQGDGEALLGKMNQSGEGLSTLAREKGLRIQETGFFIPGTAIPRIGPSEALSEALFQLSEKKRFPDKPFLLNGQYVIVQFKERVPLNSGEYNTQRAALKNGLLQAKRQETLRSWMEGTKASLIKTGRLKITKDVKDL